MRGIHRPPVNSPNKGQWRGAFVFSEICTWINGWVNNREAGDLRRHDAHYDVTVIHQINSCVSAYTARHNSTYTHLLYTTEWINALPSITITRTTRTPAFWGYPPPPHDYPYHWVILDPKSKEDKVKVTNSKISNFWILKRALHATHLLNLLDKMCKYNMDPMSIVEDTERTRFCPHTDRQTNGQGETSIPPFQLRWSGGYYEGGSHTSTFALLSSGDVINDGAEYIMNRPGNCFMSSRKMISNS